MNQIDITKGKCGFAHPREVCINCKEWEPPENAELKDVCNYAQITHKDKGEVVAYSILAVAVTIAITSLIISLT